MNLEHQIEVAPGIFKHRELFGKLEKRFDIVFTAILAQKEKQIQQNYRPVIGIHKWFARRPGTVFRNLLLSEFDCEESLQKDYWLSHKFKGVIADPFMGGGTPIFEANRLGFSVIGADINPMAYWIVRQSLEPLDLDAFNNAAEAVICDVEKEVNNYFTTTCEICNSEASVKYFIWVKTQFCPECGAENDLFPGYLLAEAERHPYHVVVCRNCGNLNEYKHQPSVDKPEPCSECGEKVYINGPAKKNRITCFHCHHEFHYPPKDECGPPKHRMWAIEYHCMQCKPKQKGRFFKRPDIDDLWRFLEAQQRFKDIERELPIPDDQIPIGDETRRLHRWGYRYFRDMFNERQLLGLGLLLRRICIVEDISAKYALLTIFSDFLRYQNMLCRYDTYALKCQDIFSVHGFPVGLVQCENNLLGFPKVGSGAFRHFIEKYRRAKKYCKQPFETRYEGQHKKIIPIEGERLEAILVNSFPKVGIREAWINCRSAETVPLPQESLDGVFTDPPYFDNVQYAELMDFCYAWLRIALHGEFDAFKPSTTRTIEELTGNDTMGRGLEHFTNGLSRVFSHYAGALKKGAPFAFTFHHNAPQAYVPIMVAILDAGLDCTETLPVPGEMGASLHIARTKSSVLDSVFVCRKVRVGEYSAPVKQGLKRDIENLKSANLWLSEGDIRCLVSGHMARVAINRLRDQWDATKALDQRISLAGALLERMSRDINVENLVKTIYERWTVNKGENDSAEAFRT